jgi:hypothetical protein
MEEMQSFQDLFGAYSRYRLSDFAKYYKFQMLRGGWKIKLSDWDNSFLSYETDRPFRICLINEINDLHFGLFLKDSCNLCVDPEDRISEINNPTEFINHLVSKYGKEKTSAVLNYYMFSQKGIQNLDNNRASLWNLISKLDQKNHYEWNDINTEAKKLLKHRRSRSYIKHSEVDDSFNEINNLTNPTGEVIESKVDDNQIEE